MTGKKGSKAIVVVAIALVLVVILAGSSFVGFMRAQVSRPSTDSTTEGTGFLDGFLDAIGFGDQDDGISDLPGMNDKARGLTAVAFKVEYSDGTPAQTFETKFQGLSMIPLTIKVNGHPISRITCSTTGKVTGATLTAWSTTTHMQTEIYKQGVSVPKTSASSDYTKTGGSWTDGSVYNLATYTVQASQLDQIVSQYGAGTYYIQLVSNVKLNTNVEGQTYNLEAKAVGALTIDYSSSGTPLQITAEIGFSPLAIVG